MPELENEFSLSQCGSSPSTFDPLKLLWLNGEKIRAKTDEQIYELFINWIKATAQEHLITGWDVEILKKAISLEHDKIKLLKDIPSLVDFFFVKDTVYDPKAVEKIFLKNKETAGLVLTQSLTKLASIPSFSTESLETFARGLAEELSLSTGKVFHPLRVAATGRTQGPSLFHLLELMGRQEVLSRIKTTLEKFFR
jgi:glutamyl-tRNA synthetase